MVRPLIGTKLYVPRPRPGLVARPRLHDLLHAGQPPRLTLVSAPAGFGKTTLLCDWAQQEQSAGRAVAWVSLDASDNEAASFWTYVVSGLQQSVPGIGADLLELLASVSAPSEGVLTALLNELADAPDEVWLVLDDYHLVTDHDVRDGLTFFLEHVSPNVHLVISTRADPDLPLPRLRVRGELVEIRASDLRFTLDEASAYLGSSAGLHLTPEDVAALEERTEGWIAALQLAALSMRGRSDASGFIAEFAGNDRYVVDYLVEEVLAHQPEQVRDFLLQTAVLDRLTGPLCDALTLRNDGAATLEGLERANLFLVRLDDQRHWYRYHHLFADVLRARLLAEQADLVPLLHQRASAWYADHDHAEEAVSHALQARDFDRAAYLMELAVPSIRRHRREALLLGWLESLPDAVVRRTPVLSVFYGYLLMVSGDIDAVGQRFDDAERALAHGPDASAPPWAGTEDLRTLPATIAIHRASLAQARGDITGTVAHAKRALQLAGPGDHLARGGASGFLGLAAWANGDVATALATFTEAVASLQAAGNLVDELTSTVVLADLCIAAGRPSRARHLYQRAMAVAEANGVPVARATAELHVGLSEMDHEAGDLDAARQHLCAATVLSERAPFTESLHRWFVARSRVAAAEGDRHEAVLLLDRAEQLYRPGFFPDVRPIAAIRARVWISQGALAQAATWAAGRRVATTDDASYLDEFDHLTLVRLLIAQHRASADAGALDGALGLLARLHGAADASGRDGSLLEIRMLTALAQDALGHRAEAAESLAHAWAQAPEPHGWVRLFLDEGAPMVGLLRVVEGQGDAGDHARRLLRHQGAGNHDGSDGGRPVRASRDLLSDRELQVLRLLDSELTGPEVARALFVSPNTLRTHTKHIFTKLDVTSRRAAVRRGHERGLL